MNNKNLIDMTHNLFDKQYELPILESSYKQLEVLYSENQLNQNLFNLVDIILKDPFLTLKLLFKISTRKRTSFDFEINSIKKGLMMLGLQSFFDLTLSSSVVVEHDGLKTAISRCQYAASKVKAFSKKRNDILPEEVQLTTLLADLDELILWVYYPDIPLTVRDSMNKQLYSRNQEAQVYLYGFRFKDLSYNLAKEWFLPNPIIELMESSNTTRALLSKYCINTSRHLYEYKGYLAIPDDIKNFKEQTNYSVSEIFSLLEISKYLNNEECQYIRVKISKDDKND